MGLEPTRYCYHKILSLARLPIPTLPHTFNCCVALITRQQQYLFYTIIVNLSTLKFKKM